MLTQIFPAQVNFTGGVSSTTGCSGFIPAVPRLDFPGLCLADNGNNIAGADYVSAFPSGFHLGARYEQQPHASRRHALMSEVVGIVTSPDRKLQLLEMKPASRGQTFCSGQLLDLSVASQLVGAIGKVSQPRSDSGTSKFGG